MMSVEPAIEFKQDKNLWSFREMAENIREVFWMFNGDLSELLYVNRMYEEIWGEPIRNLYENPRSFVEGVHPDDREQLEASMNRLMSHEEEFRLECRVNQKEKYERWVLISGVPVVDDQGRLVRITGLADDITDRKRNEKKLERLNEELEQFAFAASHDLKEPLRHLLANCDFLEEDLRENNTEEIERDLTDIRESVDTMQTLVNGLLELGRAGQAEIDGSPVELRDCVSQVLNTLEESIEDKNMTLEYGDLPVVEGDTRLLKQLFQNLIHNAIQYSEPDSRIEITVETRRDVWVIGVRDEGDGIESEYHQKIFQPFQRLQGANEQEGSGIGLATCRKIVEKHGGRIWVDSQPGEGSHFQFTLPRPESESSPLE